MINKTDTAKKFRIFIIFYLIINILAVIEYRIHFGDEHYFIWFVQFYHLFTIPSGHN